MATIHDRLVAAMQARGFRIDGLAKTRKYTVMVGPDSPYRYFVGRAGALRRGSTVYDSIPVDRLKKELLA
jgi:hypothetical protein